MQGFFFVFFEVYVKVIAIKGMQSQNIHIANEETTQTFLG